VASFAIDGPTARATCPACHHVMTVREGSPRDAPGARPVEPPRATAPAVPGAREASTARGSPDDASLCPKCGAARVAGAEACGACGLAIARMAAYIDARDAAVPDPVREAWARAAAAWDDEARHDELLRQVASHNAYAWAAGRYRTRGGDAVARRQLERLRRAAEATLLASATVRAAEARPYRGTAGVLAVLIVVIAIGLLYAVVIRDHPSPRALVPGHPVSPSTIK
jgi:hypothetical protein